MNSDAEGRFASRLFFFADFMARDLKQSVGQSGVPVVIISHYGFNCEGPLLCWHEAQWCYYQRSILNF